MEEKRDKGNVFNSPPTFVLDPNFPLPLRRRLCTHGTTCNSLSTSSLISPAYVKKDPLKLYLLQDVKLLIEKENIFHMYYMVKRDISVEM